MPASLSLVFLPTHYIISNLLIIANIFMHFFMLFLNSSAAPFTKSHLRCFPTASQRLCSIAGAQLMHMPKHKNVQAHFVLFANAWLNCYILIISNKWCNYNLISRYFCFSFNYIFYLSTVYV